MNPENLPEIPDSEDSEFELQEAVVPLALAGKRFDQTLAEMFPDFSRSRLTEWIKTGDALLDGQIARPRAPVRGGETVSLNVRTEVETTALAEDIPFEIIYQDEDVLVVNKPAGLVVHPGAGNPRGTLVNALLHFDPRMAELPRAGIVHRLDKDTSGLMVVARTRAVMDALVQRIAAREVARQYLALAHRTWSGPALRQVDAPIGRDPRNRLRMAVVESGKPSVTVFERLQDCAQGCWVRATLQTGRTHQIRVHMAHIGHPLVADELYGGAPAAGLSRQALHAYRLAFEHPVGGRALEFHAPLPADLRQALALWGLRYNDSEWLTSHAP